LYFTGLERITAIPRHVAGFGGAIRKERKEGDVAGEGKEEGGKEGKEGRIESSSRHPSQ